MSLRLLIPGAVLASPLFAAPGAWAARVTEPASPNTDDIATLFWIMVAIAVSIVVAVHVGLAVTTRRNVARRGGPEPSTERSTAAVQIRIGTAGAMLAAIVITLGAVFAALTLDVEPSGPDGLQAAQSRFAQVSLDAPGEDEAAPLRITATGQQWLWRYDYPAEADGGRTFADTFSFAELVVPVDTTVILDLKATDVVHTWWVPSLAPKADAVPGVENKTWFKADETGLYEGRSATLSGAAYATMRTWVRVVEPEEYEAWLTQKSKEIKDAQQAVQTEVDSRSSEGA